MAEQGYIHCSAGHDQVDEMLEVVYAQVSDPLLMLVIDPDRLTSRWQLDEVPGAARPYPHVYGPLNLDAVIDTATMTRAPDGWIYPWLTPSIPVAGPVRIRAADEPDWPVLRRWIVDPQLRTYLGGPGDPARADAQRGGMYGPGGFALEVDGQCIGFVTVRHSNQLCERRAGRKHPVGDPSAVPRRRTRAPGARAARRTTPPGQ
ncbi:MAG: DUF952 domain-containing protein [Nocardioidaceae bacterium]